MEVRRAIRISMSVPYLFRPVILNGDIMIDGGLLNNYPIWVFDGVSFDDMYITDEQIEQSETIGFKLDSENKCGNNTINNIIQYITCFVRSMISQIEKSHVRKGYWERTVSINTLNYNWLDFEISYDDKMKLFRQGYNSTQTFFRDKYEKELVKKQERFKEQLKEELKEKIKSSSRKKSRRLKSLNRRRKIGKERIKLNSLVSSYH
jgi:NTE family protein